MRRLLVAALSLGTLCAYGGESTFPWEELKELYRANIIRELQEAEAVREGPPVATIEEAMYHLRLHASGAEGTATISGSQLRGRATPIPLFGPGLILRETQEIAGASLLPANDDEGILLLPMGEEPNFRLVVDIVAPVKEERGNRVLTLAIPAAVRNRVRLELDEGLRLLEGPGVPGADGAYYLATTGQLIVRYLVIPEGVSSDLPEANLSDLEPMEQRPVVLDSQVLRVSFDETGRSLSTLRLTVPPEGQPRLALDPVPGSEIWALTVNGEPAQVFTDTGGRWVVPLERGRESIVELSFLREGEAIGLQGRLDVEVPRTSLAARVLYVGVELPARVTLVSVEGPVSTAALTTAAPPVGLDGAPYIFTQPFYKGEGMSVAVSYKEPVNQKP